MIAVTTSLHPSRLPSGAAFACALLLSCLSPALAGSLCPATPALPGIHLPHLRAAVQHGTEGVIVALGSSSTEGAMASDPGHTYPAVLQEALTRALPSLHFAVLNRGVGGQDAPEEVARLTRDVIAVRPQVVIWQVGANGALRNADPAEFRRLVTEGVDRMRAEGIDVILMDNQHSPQVDAMPEHGLLNAELAQVAAATGASLFPRSRLMEGWGQEGAPALEFVATDGLHHNDRGYTCVADTMAEEIVAALHETRAMSAKR